MTDPNNTYCSGWTKTGLDGKFSGL